jgi:hypothetical protein
MPTHRFEIGAVVTLAEGPRSVGANRFVIEALLPPVGALMQYRVKSEGENFRRVVVEEQLSDLSSPTAPASPSVAPPEPVSRSLPGEES